MFFHNGSLNRGCEAIVRSSVALIKEKIPNAYICLASKNPKSDTIIPFLDSIIEDRRHTIKKYSIPWFISVFNIKVLKSEHYAFQKIHVDIIEQIPNFDLFLSIGGDNYCYGEQPGIYEIDRCIKKAGKKLVLWGASIGNEDLSKAKIEDLKLMDLILTRETLTFNLLKKQNIKNVKLVADIAFLMEKEELPLPMGWQEDNTIGFNFSPLVWNKNKNSKEAALNLVQYIIDTTSMTIAFTPHVIELNNDDYLCLLDFYNKFKGTNRVLLLPNNLNAIQYKGYISRMRFFIGARTHATIAAYSSLIPTIVLGYSVKSKGIAKDIFGEEKLVLGLNELSNSDKLIKKFEELMAEEDTIKTVLKNKIPAIKKMANKAADFLFEID